MFERLLEDLGFQRLLAEQSLQLAYLALQGSMIRRRHNLFAAAGGRQLPLGTSRRHVKSWFGATPWRRATKLTVMPGSNVSSTIRTFSGAVQRRRR